MTIATIGLLDDEQITLDLAALALSELDHPGTDLELYASLLQDISSRLADDGADATRPADQAAVLAKVLHEEFGFKGDVESYDAPLNGDLIRVLDRRQGLPVSLSILYVAAARRVGWTADPLNTPGHVLVRLGGDDAVVIDPFNGGAIVRPEQLLALLGRAAAAGVAVSAEQSGPMSNRNTLVRLLMNQAMRAESANDPGRAMTIYQRMTLVAPSNPDGWWSLARLQLTAGHIDPARKSLSAMLEITRDPERREVITSVLEQISGAWRLARR
ncbi:SirB1 family protein [Sphingobium lignivorans]|uniref:Regulator of sirC expression with transglutaminase-like and TPR domain n=1 Tax=Sphingobium lignivorans TaxID=2735886 RepID=A0ABR6NH28_9SPHN|nr:transglutaminase-like domain-containing protein [Sphingobium lignivorans]MBB5986582.1 regulator of sirC expression with transglutaminase-like and TPR domain [Sphingobium lignivorans]